LKYLDESANPHYALAISDLSLRATNLSNHLSEGPARIVLNGKLMDSGKTTMTAVLRPSNKNGPDLDFDLTAQDVDLTKLNDLLRAYGKFDVAAGKASVYMQMSLKNHYMTGYVKPLFTDLKVYDAQKDKKKPILHQAYETCDRRRRQAAQEQIDKRRGDQNRYLGPGEHSERKHLADNRPVHPERIHKGNHPRLRTRNQPGQSPKVTPAAA